MKNLIAAILLFSLLLSLASCSCANRKKENDTDDTSSTTVTTLPQETLNSSQDDSTSQTETLTDSTASAVSETAEEIATTEYSDMTSETDGPEDTSQTDISGTDVTLDTQSPTASAHSAATQSAKTTVTEAEVEYFSDFKDTRLAKYFKKFDMDHIYLKLKSVKGSLEVTREFGAKSGGAYSSISDGENKVIYLSKPNSKITYLLDPAEKTYTVYSFSPLSLRFEYSGCIGAGRIDAEGGNGIYEAFYNNDGNIICHIFDDKGNWLGYENYEGTTVVQTNYLMEISGEIPSHLFFDIPSDYKYYYEDTYVTVPSGWLD